MAAFSNEREARRTRVLIADDSDLVMRELECLLSADFEIVGKATNGVDLVQESARLEPDVIVTDLEMPGLSGIEASRAALRARPGIPILLLTSHGDRDLVREALNAGIRGYVIKFAAAEELIPAVHGALRGETYISPALR
jgi:DNA-binding NarL/FixJ family response regulator